MGSMKMDLRHSPKDIRQTLEQLHRAAFGPSPALYRQLSLCGWRPLPEGQNFDTPFLQMISRQPSDPSTGMPDGVVVHETAEGVTIEVALANIQEDTLRLAISGKMVTIRAEMAVTHLQQDPVATKGKRGPCFQHVIELPSTVNAGGFQAQLVNDIVRINFSKRR